MLYRKKNFQELEMYNCIGKMEVLEVIINKKSNLESILANTPDQDLIKYFNDMTIKNIDRREEIKKNSKILLDRLIILGKEYKKYKNK
jgi:hypothetical protein